MLEKKHFNVVSNISTDIISKAIDVLRFPLALMVVFIHIYDTDERFPIYNGITMLFSQGVSRVAVPIFFIISGYLFFLNESSGYTKKIKRRITTLFFPLLLWGGVYIVLNCFLSYVTTHTWNIYRTPKDYFFSLFNENAITSTTPFLTMLEGKGFPLCFPLWFIRDLFVICISSPIIGFILKKIKFYFLFVLLIIWLTMTEGSTGYYITGLFFFSCGAFIAIMNRQIYVQFLVDYRKIYLTIWGGGLILLLINQEIPIPLRLVFILFGVAAILGYTMRYADFLYGKSKKHMNNAVFWIYATHAFLLGFFMRFDEVFKTCEIGAIIGFFLKFFIIIFVCLLSYFIMNRLFPRICAIFCGGR